MSGGSRSVSRLAAVIDGDNITRGGQLRVDDVSLVFSRVAEAVSDCPVTFAMQRRLAVRYMTAYSGHGWGIRFASMEPDAADLLLHEAAEEYAAHSVANLIVVSGDHMFSDLALGLRLHVFSYRRALSRRLQLAASTVTFLDDLLPEAA